MPEVISAIFDSPDMADFALMRLRNEKIIYDSCKIDRVSDKTAETRVGAIVNPYDTVYTGNNAGQMGATGLVGQYGGFLYTVENGVGGVRGNDISSDEVKLSIRVHSAQVDKAASSIISCHGNRVNIES
ncbi:MAG: hypothetical protein LBL09_05145 [Oscillospiraceae bacterium]|jgi:hypothetical protein|nr:hypothetical protein [Oscillospiraceae bacterium]